MKYIKIDTQEYPLSQEDIKRIHSNTSFPEQFVAPEGYAAVFPSPMPEYNPQEQYVVEGSPIKTTKGHYEQSWLVKKLDSVSIEANKAQLVEQYQQAVSAKRYEQEMKGIVINGLTLETTDRSKTLLNGAALRATLDPTHVRRWKVSADIWVDLDAATLIEAAVAVDNYVQACFDREDELLAAIADGSFTPDMLETGWSVSA